MTLNWLMKNDVHFQCLLLLYDAQLTQTLGFSKPKNNFLRQRQITEKVQRNLIMKQIQKELLVSIYK